MATCLKSIGDDSGTATESTVDQEIEDYINALIRGDYKQTLRDDGSRIRGLLRRLGESLEKEAKTQADDLVATAGEANEIGVLTARLIPPAKETSERAQSMAAAIEQLVVSVRELSATSEETASGAEEARHTVGQSVARVHEAIGAFQELANQVQQAASDVKALGEASREIGGIVKEIEKIASQTNLLALNATIEAARAGEAGKGFAVVANEVKNLSQQTAKATDDIRGRIEALLEQVETVAAVMSAGAEVAESGRKGVDTLGQEVETVGERVGMVASQIGELAGIISQQSEAAREVAQGVNVVAEMSRQNLESVQSLAAATDRLDEGIAKQMADMNELEFTGKIVCLAKADHIIWKRRLVAMAVGRLTLSPDELADHRSCRLGKWYYSDASARLAGQAAFKELEAPHKRVHEHGIAAARLFKEGRTEAALEEIAKVEEASRDVLRLLDALQRV